MQTWKLGLSLILITLKDNNPLSSTYWAQNSRVFHGGAENDIAILCKMNGEAREKDGEMRVLSIKKFQKVDLEMKEREVPILEVYVKF